MSDEAAPAPEIPAHLKDVKKAGSATRQRVNLVSNPLLVQAALPYLNAGLSSDIAVQKALEKFKDASAEDIVSATASLETPAPEAKPEKTEATPEPNDEDPEAAREVAMYRYLLACARKITGKINGLSRQELYELVCTSTDDLASFDTWVDRVEG